MPGCLLSAAVLTVRAMMTAPGRDALRALGAGRALTRTNAAPLYFLTNNEIDRRLI